MSEIDHDTRVQIAQYHFVESLSYADISRRIPGLKPSTIRICTAAEERAISTSIDDILEAIDPKPRSGAPKGPRRTKPGPQVAKHKLIRVDIS